MGLTLSLGLGSSAVRRAPNVHPRVRDIGNPSKVDGVDVIEDESGTRIDPFQISVTGRHEATRHKQGEDRPTTHSSNSARRHVR